MPSFDHSQSIIYRSKVFHIISSSFWPSFLPCDIRPHLPLFSWYSWNLTMWWHVKAQVSERILIGWCLRGHRWLGTSCFHLLGMEPSEWTWDLPFLEVSGAGLRYTRYTGLGSVFFYLGNGSVQGKVTSALPCYKSYGARPPVRPLYLVLTEPGWENWPNYGI